MNFYCDKKIFLDSINTASRAVPGKTTISALEGLLLEAADNLTITGYNHETSIRTQADVNVKAQGSAIVNAKLLADIIRKMPDSMLTVSSDDANVFKFSGGMAEFNIAGMPANEFPEFPDVNSQLSFNMNQQVFKSIIEQVSHALSQKEDQKIYNGALFDISGQNLSVIALDGVRMAIRYDTVEKNSESGDFDTFKFVVPGSALRELEKIVTSADDNIEISVDEKHIRFSIGNTTVVSRLLDGDFMDYKTVLPKQSSVNVIVERDELIAAVERVSLLISEKVKTPIKCVFEDNNLRLYAATALGNAYDEITVDSTGGKIEVGFNSKFMLDALRSAKDDQVRLELSSSISPCLIKPVEDGNYVFLILPVRLKYE